MGIAEWQEQAEQAVIREAGDLLACLSVAHGRDPHVAGEDMQTWPVATASRYVVQEWSKLNGSWMDGPSEQYRDEADARERAEEIAGWKHVDKVRVVERLVEIRERLLP